jgi:3-hydroxyisobutyrate dehydrogenase-like beta-hydroxyacid dehydrogenase
MDSGLRAVRGPGMTVERLVNKPVGVVGLGLMGEVFSRRLIDEGRAVIGYDIDVAKSERLAGMGGQAAASIADLAKAADPIVLAVFDTNQVEDVVENHILPAVGYGSQKVVLCTSTCDPDRIAALGALVIPRGIRFLETPVSGTSEQVRRGDGVGLIGGDRDTAAAVDDVLAILFPRRFHVGRVGDGGRTKLAVNLILGLNRMALAEGLVFARRLGLDPTAFLPVAKESAAYSQVMDVKGAKMLNADFAPEGRVRQTLKDVHLMLEKAEDLGQALPMLNVHCDVLEACVRAGEGEFDNSAVINEIGRRRDAAHTKAKQ